MDDHALAVLEFHPLLHRVAARAGSELGREAVLALRPSTDLPWIRRELERVQEAVRLGEAAPAWAPPTVPDARSPLRILEMDGGVLDPGGLLLLAILLRSSADLRVGLDPEPDPEPDPSGVEPPPLPHLGRLRERLPRRPELLDRIDAIVESDGSIRDTASPTLRQIRRRLRDARARLVQRLERYLESLPDRIRVPDASVSIRDGRYVVPIRREGKSAVGGVIHGESATGATLFVEPPLALRLMNELQELERDEEREILRILKEISGRLRAVRLELEEGLWALVDFDSLWARARSARAWSGELPEVVAADDGILQVLGGRHPLLLEQALAEEGTEGRDRRSSVVPFDLELEPREKALVVSGPNTGGKTVFLKTMGLVHLLAQSGIIPPVDRGTRLPLLRNVFADIGDEQSIAESLSTFSAHMANAIRILDGAGPGTLVLMDEMGTGTDPAEGAALARSILETLVERGARAVVTSHLGSMKRLDVEGSGIVNASLLFDARRIAPTYQLQKGRPGRSYGLAIARRLGLPEPVLARAESHVDSGELEVETLLATLEEKEKELNRALGEARASRERAERLEEEVELRETRLARREESAEARARDEARRLLLDARQEVEEAIAQVRRAGEAADRAQGLEEVERQARRRVEEAAQRQHRRRPEPRRPRRSRTPELAPGDAVRLVGSGSPGTVQEVEGDRVTVEVSGMRLQVAAGKLERVKASEARRSKSAGSVPSRGGWTGPEVEARPEADLRGLRVDEVELELGRALDAAIMAGLGEIRIIHGKGTGAVKARVQELLRREGRVPEFRPGLQGEGGGGVTVARLQG
ncbi:MAG: hypothetical protein EA422_15350 [Gemmatimonadales bacterium]|nr:MAG: hypothetical protein EA422_15350 [Gemmatimonadales bacterium]